MIQLPFRKYPHFTYDIFIDTKTYRFEFKWNARGEYWLMNILTTEDVIIVSGVKLVLNYGLLSDYKYLDVPQGDLFVVDITNNLSKIGYEDFTNERQLAFLYFVEGEL
jgi:hypothetical protein